MSTPTMRAISQQTYGGPEVLELVQTERPVPGPGEVLVRVQAADDRSHGLPTTNPRRRARTRSAGSHPRSRRPRRAPRRTDREGAHMIGTARQGKHEFLQRLGADELIDYSSSDFAAAVRDVDVVLDTIPCDYGPRSLDTLSAGGILIDVRGTGPDRTAAQPLKAQGCAG
jgi:NADPH:quinone reductase-like Zn-dependent oxidoreductase